ncbi:ElyC/SanA/YdcF family protein [soil metagenome]
MKKIDGRFHYLSKTCVILVFIKPGVKRFITIGLWGTLAIFLLCSASYWYIGRVTRPLIYTDAANLGEYDVAMVLGTSKYSRSGRRNMYFYHRIDAAVALYTTGKAKKILVSGDNSQREYNEPFDMLKALMDRGIPRKDIILDYAGFRTFDSMVRAREVFGQKRFIVVSQRFHLERAIYIGMMKDMDVVGFVAADPRSGNIPLFAREIMARTKAVLDCQLLGTTPKFLGQKEVIDMSL